MLALLIVGVCAYVVHRKWRTTRGARPVLGARREPRGAPVLGFGRRLPRDPGRRPRDSGPGEVHGSGLPELPVAQHATCRRSTRGCRERRSTTTTGDTSWRPPLTKLSGGHDLRDLQPRARDASPGTPSWRRRRWECGSRQGRLAAGLAAGFGAVFAGNLAGALDGWNYFLGNGFDYFHASRVIGSGDTINEFPFFTFFQADLHPHLLGFPYFVAAFAIGHRFLVREISPPQEPTPGALGLPEALERPAGSGVPLRPGRRNGDRGESLDPAGDRDPDPRHLRVSQDSRRSDSSSERGGLVARRRSGPPLCRLRSLSLLRGLLLAHAGSPGEPWDRPHDDELGTPRIPVRLGNPSGRRIRGSLAQRTRGRSRTAKERAGPGRGRSRFPDARSCRAHAGASGPGLSGLFSPRAKPGRAFEPTTTARPSTPLFF